MWLYDNYKGFKIETNGLKFSCKGLQLYNYASSAGIMRAIDYKLSHRKGEIK